jgi:ribosome-binding factor A
MKKRGDRLRLGMNEGAGPGQRQLRVGEEIRHALSKILHANQCHDPALVEASITVTEVRMSPDLRNGTVFVMPLAGANAADILAGLKRSAGFLKGLVAREVWLRNAPNLAFALDESFDRVDRISALLARPDVARDLQRQPIRSGEGADEG